MGMEKYVYKCNLCMNYKSKRACSLTTNKKIVEPLYCAIDGGPGAEWVLQEAEDGR